MSKPTNKPGWNPTSNLSEPSPTKKSQGWAAGEKPAAEHFNWLMKTVSEWIDYVDTAGVQGPQGEPGPKGDAGEIPDLLQSVYASFAGILIPTVGNMRWKPRSDITVTNVKMTVGSAPSTALVIDILKNGTSIFDGTSFPTIPVGQLESLDFSVNAQVLSADYITVNITSGNGQNLNVRIDYTA